MELVYLVLPIALLLAAAAVAAFTWSARSGQLDDLETPAHRILFDDELEAEPQRDDTAGSGNDDAPEGGRLPGREGEAD